MSPIPHEALKVHIVPEFWLDFGMKDLLVRDPVHGLTLILVKQAMMASYFSGKYLLHSWDNRSWVQVAFSHIWKENDRF